MPESESTALSSDDETNKKEKMDTKKNDVAMLYIA